VRKIRGGSENRMGEPYRVCGSFIKGKSYSDFTFYEKAYLDTYVYQK